MAIALLIAFVVSNACWLLFLRNHLKDDMRERWELQERKRKPEAPKPPPVLSDTEKAQLKKMKLMAEDNGRDEFDLVGKVNPDTPLREDE